VSTEQAVAELKREFGGFDAIADRVRAVSPAEGAFEVLADLGLSVASLHHGREGNPPIQNNAYLLELGGHVLLHVGDSQATAEELEPLDLPSRGIDVAFLPHWYLDTEPWAGTVDARVKAGRTVVMHLAPRWNTERISHNQQVSRKSVARIREKHPEAVVFEEYGQSRVFPAAGE